MAEVSPEMLLERLARGKAIGAVVLQGTDPYLRDMCRKKIVEAFVPEGVARMGRGAHFCARIRLGRNPAARRHTADVCAAAGDCCRGCGIDGKAG